MSETSLNEIGEPSEGLRDKHARMYTNSSRGARPMTKPSISSRPQIAIRNNSRVKPQAVSNRVPRELINLIEAQTLGLA